LFLTCAGDFKLQEPPDLGQAEKGLCMSSKDDWPREKQWKNLYTRSVKLARAQQLGIDYPRTTEKQLIQGEVMSALNEKLKVLFICSRNQWRSPTAEQLWRRHPKVSTRSAGTSPNARHKAFRYTQVPQQRF
jgi:hypothetical protein